MTFLIFMLLFWLVLFFNWVTDTISERLYQGNHTSIIVRLIKKGIILFILSEVIFFFSFFWTFFHSSLNPAVDLGYVWPPSGITPINPFLVPFLNTLILVSSGVRVTFSHHSMLNHNKDKNLIWLTITVILGLYFTFLQYEEYLTASFSIMDSVYGSIFFMATGFHGLHVIIGSLFLLVRLIRLYFNQFSSFHHVGFETACWYWHFVDLVWLFLFIFIYWWAYN